MIKQTLDLPPLSVNKVWRGRRFMTKEYKDWLKQGLLLMGQKKTIETNVSVHLDFYFKYPNKCDIDNPIKTVLDLIVKRGWLKDDRQIQSLSVCKNKGQKEKIVINILGLNENLSA